MGAKLNLIIPPDSPNPPNMVEDAPTPESPPVEEDKFRKGTIIKYFPQSSYGFIRDHRGKEIYFHLDELRLIGPKNDRSYVREGAPLLPVHSLAPRCLRRRYTNFYP